MGVVFGPRDITKGRRKFIENALEDINPVIRDSAMELLTSWEGAKSEERLKQLMGKEKAQRFLDEMKIDR